MSRTRGQHHGFIEQRYINVQEQPSENSEKSLSTSSYQQESLSERGGNEKAKNLSESSGILSLPNLPPPRPSLWKELYLKILKPKEKSFENNLMTTSRRRLPEKKHVRQLKRTRPLKKIQKSVGTRRASYFRQSNYITEVLPVNKEELKIYDLECDREDGNESSTSVSPASTRLSAASDNRSISISSEENREKSSIRGYHCVRGVQATSGMADTEKEGMVKSRERLGWRQNKDGVVNLDLKRPGNKLGINDFEKKK